MIIKIKARPNSGKEEVIKVSDEEYRVYLKKSAEDNKANIELLKLLKEYFGKNANILKGLKSKNKIIKISSD